MSWPALICLTATRVNTAALLATCSLHSHTAVSLNVDQLMHAAACAPQKAIHIFHFCLITRNLLGPSLTPSPL